MLLWLSGWSTLRSFQSALEIECCYRISSKKIRRDDSLQINLLLAVASLSKAVLHHSAHLERVFPQSQVERTSTTAAIAMQSDPHLLLGF